VHLGLCVLASPKLNPYRPCLKQAIIELGSSISTRFVGVLGINLQVLNAVLGYVHKVRERVVRSAGKVQAKFTVESC
jgi:hypothetical protein